MKKYSVIIFFILLTNNTFASFKNNIIENLSNIENISFEFEQNTNGKIENGECIIKYPKKIYCEYKIKKKLLVSNGNSLVIKTASSFYIYPIQKTPLNLLLDKDFLLKKIKKTEGEKINNKFISYNFTENDNKISLFFDRKSYNLIGWQTTDIYQNINSTFLSSINKNISIKESLFNLPTQE
jgi:outer membrane lipoprotein-sorting protein